MSDFIKVHSPSGHTTAIRADSVLGVTYDQVAQETLVECVTRTGTVIYRALDSVNQVVDKVDAKPAPKMCHGTFQPGRLYRRVRNKAIGYPVAVNQHLEALTSPGWFAFYNDGRPTLFYGPDFRALFADCDDVTDETKP